VAQPLAGEQMADDLSVAFERLRTSTSRLNALTDVAAQTIRDTEAYLEELHVGVAAWVPVVTVWDEKDVRDRCEISLQYIRPDEKKFRVVVEFASFTEDFHHGDEVKPWAECTREHKLRTFEKLPDLLVEIARKVDEQVSKAEQTVAEVAAKLPLPKKRKGGDK
jgi:hypothetical protein